MKVTAYIFLFLIIPITLSAQSTEQVKYKLSGFADTYHALRSQSPNDYMSSRSRLRLELSATTGNTYLYTSINAIHNSLLSDQSKLELREAFFQYTTPYWDFKIGRQIITWGVADGTRITDIISPMDYTEFLARDYDDIRIPVNGFRIKYIQPNYNLDIVFVPVPEFFVIPVDKDNPWSITHSLQHPYSTDMSTTPDKTIKNAEFGSRFSFYLRGIDFSISALHSWNKNPIFSSTYTQSTDTIHLRAHYNRMTMVGLDFSMPINQLVIRGECAEYFNELQEATAIQHTRKNASYFLLGVDWYAQNDWTLMAQYYHKLINDYDKNMITDKHTSCATISIAKKTLRNTLSLSIYSYIDLQHSSSFTRFTTDYSLNDQIHLIAGYDWFYGTGDTGIFAAYKNNSEYFVKAKYYF